MLTIVVCNLGLSVLCLAMATLCLIKRVRILLGRISIVEKTMANCQCGPEFQKCRFEAVRLRGRTRRGTL
jgi:hypothetical protein